MTTVAVLVLLLVPLAVVARGTRAVWRFARLSPAAKRNYLPALRARVTWRWLCRNQGIAYTDLHRRRRYRFADLAPGTSARVTSAPGQAMTLRYPRARFRPDDYGFAARVRTIPRVGRKQLEDAAPHIADAWRCVRVQVRQERPGRLTVRGLRVDPLTLPYPYDQLPAGVLGHLGAADLSALRVYLGLDEWGEHRWLDLPGITGITVGGLPGFGKTEFVRNLLGQLAQFPARFVIVDGKGSGDYEDYRDRAWIMTGDELPAAAGALEDAHGEMRARLANVTDLTGGYRNAWHVGPTSRLPLLVTVLDECHTFFDLESVKGDREAEAHVRTCRGLGGQLVKKGRSVLAVTLLITQKQTADAIPTAIRDNCRAGFSFATRTRDASVAALGEHIREYQGYDPSTLQDPAYVGVCTASLRTGSDPFVRLRVPQLDLPAAAARRARETAGAP